jgi:hypothetical protein
MSNTLTRRHIALRIPQDDLAQIDGLAEDYGLTRTAYMIRASTGELHDPIDLEARFRGIEDRLGRVEHMAGLGAFE